MPPKTELKKTSKCNIDTPKVVNACLPRIKPTESEKGQTVRTHAILFYEERLS